MSSPLIDKRIERLEMLTEELIRKLARVNVANYYLSQRIEVLEEQASNDTDLDTSNQQKKLSLVSNE